MLPILRMRFLSPLTISSVSPSILKPSPLFFANGANSVSNISAMERSLNGFMTGCFLAAVQTEIHQQVVYHPCHAPGGIIDSLCVTDAVVRFRVVQQQFGVAADGGQRGAQFVGDVLDEVAPQFDQLFICVIALLQLSNELLTLFPFVVIASDFPVDGEIRQE